MVPGDRPRPPARAGWPPSPSGTRVPATPAHPTPASVLGPASRRRPCPRLRPREVALAQGDAPRLRPLTFSPRLPFSPCSRREGALVRSRPSAQHPGQPQEPPGRGGETHLHSLVADRSEVPGPALERRGASLGTLGGRPSHRLASHCPVARPGPAVKAPASLRGLLMTRVPWELRVGCGDTGHSWGTGLGTLLATPRLPLDSKPGRGG